ncbi:MAG: HD domain-containing protein [Clostridia bacterium]|nr:HD domain-containing protein [Clostridia bacterium]
MKSEELIAEIARRVDGLGGQALLVGGCVRDGLLGIPCYDIDCEVHGVERDALLPLLREFGEIDASGEQYGIFTIKGVGIDIALPRREKRTGPGHRDFAVEVNPQLTPDQAAARRDFTVNAIMRDALTGEYIDPYGGMKDLQDGVLRAMPGAHFEEDPLRVLRGAQFAARFHLTPDAKTIERMKNMPLDRLSAARVLDETKKALLKADCPDVFFRVLRDADALEPWFHELAALDGVPQNPRYHPEGDAFEHTMLVLRAAAEVRCRMRDPLEFMLACLTHDLGKAVSTRKNEKGAWQSIGHERTGVPLVYNLLLRLGLSKAMIAYAQNMCALHMRLHTCYHGTARVSRSNILFDESTSPEELGWLVVCDSRGTGKPRGEADAEEAFIRARLDAYAEAVKRPMPDAKMLMDAGAMPGPALGRALREARRLVLSGETAERAAARAAKQTKTNTDNA